MRCRIADLKCKEVINISTGFRMGYVYDVTVNVVTGQVISIVVPGPCRFFGIFGREEDYVIPWECIRRIGDDIILVELEVEQHREKRPRHKWM